MNISPHSQISLRPHLPVPPVVDPQVALEIFEAMEPGYLYLNSELQDAYEKKTGVRPSPTSLGRALADLGAQSRVTRRAGIRQAVRGSYRAN